MDLIERREKRLKMPEIGIVEPASVVSYAPFDESRYPHKARLNLARDPWPSVMQTPATDLLSPDPFARSKFRDGCAVWDSVAVPQSKGSEQDGVILDDNVQPLTQENTFLQKLRGEYMTMVGCNEHGQPVRPSGLYLLDLTRMGPTGWFLAEGAHALAHLRCDGIRKNVEPIAFPFIIRQNMFRALAALVHGILFKVPVYIGPEDPDGRSAAWPATSIAVAPFDRPLMKTNRDNRYCPEPDNACVKALYLYHVEPVPEAYVAKTVKSGVNDEWSGFPTLVAFAGWDGMDSVMHARIGVHGPYTKYISHAQDLIEPQLFPEAIELAKKDGVPVPPDGDWVLPSEWLGSEAWLDLVSETPPLPCTDCYAVNSRTPGAPSLKSRSRNAYRAYMEGRNHCIAIAAKAAIEYETNCFLAAGIRRPQHEKRFTSNRKRLNKANRKAAEERRMELVRRKLSGKSKSPLTEGQRKLLEKMKKEGNA